MSKSAWGSLVLVLALLGFTPAASADMSNDQLKSLRDLLSGVEELKGLDSQLAKFNPVRNGFSREVNIFGLTKVTLYVYFPDGGARAPVAALKLPSIALSTIIPPLKGTPMDVTLDSPLVLAAMKGYLHVDKMPEGLAKRAHETGFTSAFHVDGGLNTFGKVAGNDDLLHQVLRLINLNGPLLAGYVSPSGKKVEDPNDPDKEKKLKDRVLYLALTDGKPWKEPFFLKHTAIERASIQFRRSKERDLDPQTHIRVIGKADIGNPSPKAYDLFVEKTFDKTAADPKSLALVLAVNPTGAVSLADFTTLGEVFGATLGLPVDWLDKAGKLPLEQIKLRNPHPASEAFPEAGGYPDFAKVMFAGANPPAKIPGRSLLTGQGPLLTVNADATVFGLDAAGLEGTVSLKDGLKVDAKVKAPHLGPITLAKAELDVAASLKTAHARLNAEAAALGTITVEADSKGLSFAVPAQCPLKPVGLVASIDGFDLTKDFSVTPQMKDCLAPILGELVKDAEKAVTIAAGIAGEAADEAAGLAKEAEGAIAGLAGKRAEAWGKAVANKVHAGKALGDAKAAVGSLTSAIKDLDDSIESLGRDIEKGLRKLVGAITSALKTKKKERQHKIAERDDKRTQLAAAKQREQQAAKAAANTPAPYHDDALRQAQADELGAMATAAQQARFADEARKVPDLMKSAETRREIFDADAVAKQAEAAFIKEHGSTLKAVLASFGSLDAATQAPVPGAEALANLAIDGKLDALRETILREEVAKLPTMTFGKRVLLQFVKEQTTLCLTQRDTYEKISPILEFVAPPVLFKPCDGSPRQELVFHDSGLVEVPESATPPGWERGKPACLLWGFALHLSHLCQDDPNLKNRFFFDPLDNRIRANCDGCTLFQIGVGEDGRSGAMVASGAPEPHGIFWRLIDAEQFRKGEPLARATRRVGGPLRASSTGAPEGTVETNLAPLVLE